MPGGKTGKLVLSHGNGVISAVLGAETAADTVRLVQLRPDRPLEADIVSCRLRAVKRATGKTDLELVMAGRCAEQLLIHFQRRLLGIDQAVGVILAAAAGGRHADAGATGSDLLVALPQLRHDSVEILEIDINELDRLANREMYHPFLAVLVCYRGYLFEPLNRQTPAGNPQPDGKEVLAPFLDEAASLEILQVDGSVLILFRHQSSPLSNNCNRFRCDHALCYPKGFYVRSVPCQGNNDIGGVRGEGQTNIFCRRPGRGFGMRMVYDQHFLPLGSQILDYSKLLLWFHGEMLIAFISIGHGIMLAYHAARPAEHAAGLQGEVSLGMGDNGINNGLGNCQHYLLSRSQTVMASSSSLTSVIVGLSPQTGQLSFRLSGTSRNFIRKAL